MNLPFFKTLSAGQRILLAGVGGGFDIINGIPLYLYLRQLGKEVVLANLSFTELEHSNSEEICPGTYAITPQSDSLAYFPEKYLLEWLISRGESPIIYGFSNELGVLPLRVGYAEIVKRHEIDTLLLVDGGTDSLIFGDEPGIGTVVEDACSMIAAAGLGVERSLFAAIGFGIDHYHDVNHHACLENIATLIRENQYLGAFSLTKDMPEGQGYLELVDFLNQRMTAKQSIVTNSIASAMRGEFGNHHATERTQNSELFINPLMSLYWTFHLQGIVNRMEFAERIDKTETMTEVWKQIKMFRSLVIRRMRQAIPL